MPAQLVDQLDAMAGDKGYSNRSQAVADMVRAHLVEHHAQIGRQDIAGTVTLVYDHHKRGIQAALTKAQHAHQDLIFSVLHVHLDSSNCMEVLAVRGPAGKVKRFADRLTATKGITHSRLTVTTTGRKLT
jgi:CopG family nickel-responsive transcriptional regulator